MLVQIVHQLQGEEEQALGNEVGGGPEFDGGIQLLQAGVEVQRGLVAKYCVLVEAQGGGQLLNVVNDGAVTGYDPLRYAGGPGGKDDVQRVGVQLDGPDAVQQGLVGLAGGRLLVVVQSAGTAQLLRQSPGLAVAQDGTGLRVWKISSTRYRGISSSMGT